MIDALTRFQNEQRSVEYIKLDAAQAGTIDPPSPETLAAYFDDHKTQFRAPEYRKLSFVVINPEEIGKWTEVSDEDAKKVFEQRRDKLGTPERREVSQMVFPNAEEALAARGRITSGLSFDDLAKERKLNASDVDLGMIAKSAIIDPAVADAAFSLPSGEVSQPVQGQFGVALVKIGKIEPGVTPVYESVAAQLKKEIATERARAKVAELHNKMEDERGGGASVVEAAQKLGLTAVTIDAVDRSGRMPNGQPVAIFRTASMWSRRPSAATSASTTTRSSSPAAMSGTTCSASRRRASARSTRSRTRSRRDGATTRSRPSCAPRPPRWSASSNMAPRSPRKRRRRVEGRNRGRLPARRLAARRAPQAW